MTLRTPRRFALLSALCCLALGCNVVTLLEDHRARKLRALGLSRQKVDLGEHRLSVWDGGSGPPVLLLHGFGAKAIWQWFELASDLAADHRVLMPDLLWFGGSISSAAKPSLDHQVEALLALLDARGLEEPVDIVGISYGGFVATELAARSPARVRRLVLVDSPGRCYERSDMDALTERLGTPRIAEVLLPSDEAGLDRLMDLAYQDPPWVPGFVARQSLRRFYSDTLTEKRALLDELVEAVDEIPDRPGEVRAETLFVWGRGDTLFPLELGQRAAKARDARLEIIEDARHAPQLEHPAHVNALIRAFLDTPATARKDGD
jgi:pimeloyl-ACP methyl ester carboxylesterase